LSGLVNVQYAIVDRMVSEKGRTSAPELRAAPDVKVSPRMGFIGAIPHLVRQEVAGTARVAAAAYANVAPFPSSCRRQELPLRVGSRRLRQQPVKGAIDD
jgi:hypothetical protein